MSCDIKIENIIFHIEKIWRTDKINKEIYIFVGNINDKVKYVLEKLEKKENIKNKEEIAILKNKYSNYYLNWIKFLKNNIKIKFIYESIYIDDNINDIRKKIFVYLSKYKENYFILPENQELWLENNKQKEVIGFYYENKYDEKILLEPCIYIKPLEDKEFRVGVNYKINTSENNILIKDLLDILNIKSHTIYLTDAIDEEKYIQLKTKTKNISKNLINTYFKKHFPFYKNEVDLKKIKKNYLDLQNFYKKENYFYKLQDNSNNIENNSTIFGNCNIINIQIKINTFKKDKQVIKNLDLYQVFDYLREKKLDINTPFIKYGEDLINIPVSIISREALLQDKIKKNKLKDWILKDLTKKINGINIKRFIKDYNNEPRYLSLNLKKNTEIDLFMAFENNNNANFYDISYCVKNCKNLIDDINKNIISQNNNIKFIEPPNMDIKNNIILLKDNTKIKFMNIMIPIKKEQKFDFKKLYEYSKNFSSYLYDDNNDLDPKNKQTFENDLKLRYKKVSSFTPMNKIIHFIDILRQDNYSDGNIINILQKKYEISVNEASKYLLEWKKKLGSTKNLKIDPEFKLGIKIEINNSNIKLSGITKTYLVPIIYNFITTFINLYLKHQKKNNEKLIQYFNNKNINNNYNNIDLYQYNKNVSLDLFDYNNINKELNSNNYDINNLNTANELYHNINKEYNTNNNNNNNNINGLASVSDIVPEARLKCDDAIPEKSTCGDYCNDNSYFIRRLQLYDNQLFKPEKEKGNKNKKIKKKTKYSIICQRKRQPIILPYDPEEKKNVKRDSFTYSIKYSTRPEYPRWYICPNIWCPICEIPISENDIDKKTINKRPTLGEGGVCITAMCPFGEHQVIIREESDAIYPGFTDSQSNDGFCLPCCYNLPHQSEKYKAKYKRYKKCMKMETENNNVKNGKIYILGKTSPIDNDRYGLLPTIVSKLLNTKLDTGYLEFEKGYLKKGIKQYENNSFLSCILDIFSCDKINMNVNIDTLINILIDKLDENLFRSLYNGNLQVLFDNSKVKLKAIDNYKNYLKNKKINITHLYLWDFLQRENILFENGINIFIFENNKLLCPKGENTNIFYDINKKNILLLKTGKIYEPIYYLEGEGKQALKKCLFNSNLIEIKKLYEIAHQGCSNIYDIDWEQVLKKNIKKNNLKYSNTCITFDYSLQFVLEELIKSIKNNKLDKGYIPLKQYIDSYNKVYALLLNNNLYIPIKPSALLDKLKYEILIDNKNLPKISFKDTIKFFSQINKNTELKYEIHTKILDLKDKKEIIALVNNNGRVIPIIPIKNNDKTLEVSHLNYYSDLDEAIENNIIMHDQRIEKINKKNFEDETYNRMRFDLANFIYRNKKYSKEIEEIIKNDKKLDLNIQRKNMYKILNTIFSNITTQKKHSINYNYYKTPNKRIPCFIRNIKKIIHNKYENILSCDDDPHCVIDKNSCKLYINKYNLLEIYNGIENYNYYLSKILDELIRYKIKREEILYNRIDNIINKQLIPEDTKKYLLIKSLDEEEVNNKIEQIYYDNKGVFIDNRDLYELSTTKEFAFNKNYYLKSNIDLVNNYKYEELSIYWFKYLGDKFKVNTHVDTLFNLIANAMNSNKNFYSKNKNLDNIDIKDLIIKNIMIPMKNKKNINKLEQKIFNKYKESCSSNELTKVNNFEELIIFINNNDYKGCSIDLEYISKLYNINIIILDKRIKKNQQGFDLYLTKESKYYILIYRFIVSDQYLYNLIGIKNKFLFYEKDLSPKFMNEIIFDNHK
jgi:hypothetical protein